MRSRALRGRLGRFWADTGRIAAHEERSYLRLGDLDGENLAQRWLDLLKLSVGRDLSDILGSLHERLDPLQILLPIRFNAAAHIHTHDLTQLLAQAFDDVLHIFRIQSASE